MNRRSTISEGRGPFPEGDEGTIAPGRAPEQSGAPPTPREGLERFLPGGGEMGERTRSFDWGSTTLGPVASWPTSLRTMVGVLLNSRFPKALWWGPDLVSLYNDGYRPILGQKHPAALGASAPELWSEIWDVLEPQARSVLDEGVATWNEHLLLLINRRGFTEETYFTFSYSPVLGDTGGVGGVLITCQETTEQIQDERQLRMLRDLTARTSEASSAEAACRTATEIFAANDADVPFSLLYLLDDVEEEARLASTSGLEGYEGPAMPARLALRRASDDASAWPLLEVLEAGRDIIVDDLATRFGALPGGRWDASPERAAIVPLSRAGQPRPYGFLIAGLSPRRPLDDRYRGLFRLIADPVAAAIADARSHEEERARMATLAELDRAKTTFFSNISHEFRTPLTLILGPVEDALASGAGSLGGDELRAVHRNALRLLKLVNALLEFSRIEGTHLEASLQPLDLATLTSSLASAFESAIEQANLKLELDCPPLPYPVYVDRDQWEKIVLNLISNAFKFTFDGHIRVSLRASGDQIRLEVSDTGTGIAEAELPRIFERFHRIQGARSRTHEGSGIGLALVAELVKLHGGTIEVSSTINEGTTFSVTMPRGSAEASRGAAASGASADPEAALAPAATAAAPYVEEAMRWLPEVAQERRSATTLCPPAPPEPPEQRASTRSPRARILFADDNADMRAYVQRVLGEHWEVVAVPDGAAALDAARRNRPDLVLTDVMMPKLDGLALLGALRAGDDTRSIPVIMLSARAGEESRVEGLEAGASDYLIKPFSARELVARVATHLQIAALRRAAVEERARMFSLFEQAPVAMAVVRGEHHAFELVNRCFEEMVGPRPLLGRRFVDAFPELAALHVDALFDRVRATGEPFSAQEFRADLDRGAGAPEESTFSFNLHPVRDTDDGEARLVIVAVDITERVRARTKLEAAAVERGVLLAQAMDAQRRAEAASRAKDEFLAMLGHELRNPLAPIVTALELMRLRAGGVAERERSVIERQVKHLALLVDDLLDVSRITRGMIPLKKRRMELAEVVSRALDLASPLLEQRHQHLRVAVPTPGLAVDADPTRLTQVVSNILTNAAKYTAPHGHIDVEASRDQQGEIVLCVRDDGIGIAPEMLPRVFDLFMQERQALDRAEGGLGLGLAIVRSLVTLHGGSVVARSKGKGFGAEFVVRLPAAGPAAATDPALGPHRSEQTPPPASRHRILIVDDNPDAATLLADSLTARGHTTRVAHDGPAALRLADEFLPDVALLDIGLPVMDGYELAHRLRERPPLRHIRLIAVTGYGQADDRRRSREAGFDVHLVKPVQLKQLGALLDEPT
jgi:PAS domain S-box-containing protein